MHGKVDIGIKKIKMGINCKIIGVKRGLPMFHNPLALPVVLSADVGEPGYSGGTYPRLN